MEMAGLGGVDSLDTPARRRNAGDRERWTDARTPRLVGDPRVAIDQRYLRERNLFLVLLAEPVIPDAI